MLVLRRTAWLQVLVSLGALGLGLAWGRGSLGRLSDRLTGGTPPPRPDLDEAALRAHLEREHPDWDPERVERVAKGIIRQRDQTRGDD
jgi:hypothetical protein